MKHTITKLFLLLLLATAGTAKAQQWTEIQTGVTEDLYDICCIDENTVFVCGQNGIILKTEDGGVTWQEKNRNPSWEIISIKFADENTGYGLVLKNGYEILLIKTTDFGESWFRVNKSIRFDKGLSEYQNDDPLEFFTIGKPAELSVLNADTLFIRCYDGLARSSDGGQSFVGYDLGFSQYPGGIGDDNIGIKGEYFEDNFGWVIGYDSENHNALRVMKTEDCGDHWENIAKFEFSNLCITTAYSGKDRVAKIYGEFINYNGSGTSYNVIETSDGFEHATLYHTDGADIGHWNQYSDVDYYSQRHGCIISSMNWDKAFYSESHAYVCDDYGLSWTEVPYGIHKEMFVYSVAATDTTFFISSQKGKLYKYDNNPYQEVGEKKLELSVFPNPVENMLEIKMENIQSIDFYDFLGRKVLGIPVEQNRIMVDVSRFYSGIYSVVITDREGIHHTEKLVKL